MLPYTLFGLILASLHFGTDFIFFQWLVGILLCVIPIFIWLKEKTSLIFASNIAAFIAYVAYVNLSSFSVYATLPVSGRMGYSLASSMGLLCVLVPILALLVVDVRVVLSFVDALPFLALINSTLVIVNWAIDNKFTNSMGHHGFVDYSGMNGVYIAICLIPTIKTLFNNVKDRFSIIVAVLGVIALLISKGSIAWGVLTCGILGVILTLPKGPQTLLKLSPIALVPLLIAGISEGPNVIDSGRRFEAYQVFLNYWWNSDPATRLFGFGPSSFQVMSGMAQKKASFMVNPDGSIWVWLRTHSDPIQTIIEYGIIGFGLTASLAVETLIKLYRKNDKTVFAIACSIVGSSIFDYPCRLWVTAILVMWVIVYAYRSEELST